MGLEAAFGGVFWSGLTHLVAGLGRGEVNR